MSRRTWDGGGRASRTSGDSGEGDVSSGWRELLWLRHAVSDPWICVRGTFAAQKHDTMEYNDPSTSGKKRLKRKRDACRRAWVKEKKKREKFFPIFRR